jgi:putative transcriptional regulator
MPRLHAGRLLVAVPGVLEDPNFRRTVVLLLEHSEQGALGLVLNRPSDQRVEDPFPGWDGPSSAPAVLFMGGPVQQGMIVALGRAHSAPFDTDGFQPVPGPGGQPLGTVDLRRSPVDLAPMLDALRVFSGYAGWSPGQLDAEIEHGAWWVVDAEPSDPFVHDPSGLWRRVLRRQPPPVAWFAHYPDDPADN